MQEKAGAGYFIEIVVVVALLGALSAIAIPHINHLFGKGKTESYDSELHNIQTAVTAMQVESAAGILITVGPTADMSQVQTIDAPPLKLTDFLYSLDDTLIRSGCTYTFNADGTVIQTPP
ncbi:Tfp pilus assembly protein FimT/FimU [Chloroflexota bacterium]